MSETVDEVLAREPGYRLGGIQERRLRRWPLDRIRPKGVADGLVAVFAEVDALRAFIAESTGRGSAASTTTQDILAKLDRLKRAIPEGGMASPHERLHREATVELIGLVEDLARLVEEQQESVRPLR